MSALATQLPLSTVGYTTHCVRTCCGQVRDEPHIVGAEWGLFRHLWAHFPTLLFLGRRPFTQANPNVCYISKLLTPGRAEYGFTCIGARVGTYPIKAVRTPKELYLSRRQSCMQIHNRHQFGICLPPRLSFPRCPEVLCRAGMNPK